MKKKYVFPMIFTLIFLFTLTIYPKDLDIYCYISLVENDVFILKSDKDEVEKAVVNYPLLSGDIIYTNRNAKCEIQFGNGTIIRMDKHTELRLSTLRSPSLTTNKKITTLHLNKGHIFSMNQVYRGEIFQIITPTASLKMFKRSSNSILVNKKGETHLFVERGKVGVLYDGNLQTPRQEFIGAKKGCWIKDKSKLIMDNQKQNYEFLTWNEKINKNFKDLHYGISKVPQVIYRRSPGIVHFAERFSTKFGSWEYHELFGYIWKPADFVFHNQRPFWDANYVEVNGELFLIPNQSWGWAPAHLGTWFWSKTDGWIWIPGDAFSPGICSKGLISWPREYFNQYGDLLYQVQFISWITRAYGSVSLYKIYRINGAKAWRVAYQQKFNKKSLYKKPSFKNIPANLRTIIKKIKKVPIQKVVQYLENNTLTAKLKFNPVQVKILQNQVNKKKLPTVLKEKIYAQRNTLKDSRKQTITLNQDWNPDSNWARKAGVKIFYSLKKNQVVCPKLKLNSKSVNNIQKGYLRRSVINRNHGLSTVGNAYTNPAWTVQSSLYSSPPGTGINSTPAKTQGSANGNQVNFTSKVK